MLLPTSSLLIAMRALSQGGDELLAPPLSRTVQLMLPLCRSTRPGRLTLAFGIWRWDVTCVSDN
jgi:hypothetical protein